MKQKSINLLTQFLNNQLTDHSGFSFCIDPEDEYNEFWNFSVTITDEDLGLDINISFKVDYKDESVWICLHEDNYEKVEEDRWNAKYFWFMMYCKK